MKKIIFVFCILVFISLSNCFSFVYIVFLDGGIHKKYVYETYDGKEQFVTMPGKGRDCKSMELVFVRYCKKHETYTGTQLYRTFKINPLKYWRWYEFVTHPRYKYPYKRVGKNLIPKK